MSPTDSFTADELHAVAVWQRRLRFEYWTAFVAYAVGYPAVQDYGPAWGPDALIWLGVPLILKIGYSAYRLAAATRMALPVAFGCLVLFLPLVTTLVCVALDRSATSILKRHT